MVQSENREIRVLIAAGIYPPDAGGPAVHAKTQLERFPEFGLQTGLVAFAHYRHLPRGIRHFLYFLKLLVEVPKYDLIYAHDALGAGIPALLAARLFGRKFMVRVGGDITWEYRGDSSLSMEEWYSSGRQNGDKAFIFSRWLLRHADAVVTVSKLLSDLYIKYYGVDAGKIKIIENPIPEVSAAAPLGQEQTIIFASRLVAYKNLSLVLRVLSKIFPSHPDLKFLIMGDGPDRSQLGKLAEDLGIEENVVFADSIPNSEVLKRTAVSLFAIAPALTEFNPNYILQSIAFGKPFLISRENGLPFEVPADLLFDPRNEEELHDRILNLLDSAGYEKALSEVRSIGFKMTWEDNLGANAEVIKSLLKA